MNTESFFDVPAGHSDADIEQAGLYALGRRDSALRKRGICSHGWSQGIAPCKCLHCGKVFATFDAMCEERHEVLA